MSCPVRRVVNYGLFSLHPEALGCRKWDSASENARWSPCVGCLSFWGESQQLSCYFDWEDGENLQVAVGVFLVFQAWSLSRRGFAANWMLAVLKIGLFLNHLRTVPQGNLFAPSLLTIYPCFPQFIIFSPMKTSCFSHATNLVMVALLWEEARKKRGCHFRDIVSGN